MNKIILATVMLFIWVAATAQISDPRVITPGNTIHKEQKLPVKPALGVPEGGVGKNTPAIIHDSYISPTFDPTWAARFQTVLDSVVLALDMKGASMAVLAPEQGLWTGVSGISIPGVPVTSEMRFGIGSNTKLFVAVTLAYLQEQGILSLDDHLYQWLPAYPNVDSTATIRQLLSHQTGIFDFWNDRISMLYDSIWADTSRFWTSEETLATIGDPHFTPGHGFSYSNTNYLLAGMVIEEATGASWVQKIHDVIFDSLVMDSTFAGAFEPRNGPVAAEWDVFNEMLITNSPMTAEYSQANAAGAILSTAQELAEWYSALFSGTVISDSSLLQVTDFEPTSFYGLGLEEGSYKNHLSYNHTGGVLGYASLAWYDLQTQAVICILMNDRYTDFNSRIVPLLGVFYDEYPKKQNDAGILAVANPWENSCSPTIIPSVIIQNFGSDQLTSVNLNYKIDGNTPATFNWAGTLETGDTAHVNLPGINTGVGSHTLTCYTSLPNGYPEGYTYNDTMKSNFIINALPAVITSLYESFEGPVFPPEGWAQGSASYLEWGRTRLASFIGSCSAGRGNYNDGNIGARYDLDLPLIHIAEGTHPVLEFEYAYAIFPGYYGDSLQVFISTDCGANWLKIYNKGGYSLHTAPTTSNSFYPQSGTQWKKESIPLEEYNGDVLIRFRSVCGWSNNLFLDDVNVTFPVFIVENNSFKNRLKFYPNPSITEITIETPTPGHLCIMNLHGQPLITRQVTEAKTVIDISTLPSGVYVVRVVGDKGVQVGKFIKE